MDYDYNGLGLENYCDDAADVNRRHIEQRLDNVVNTILTKGMSREIACEMYSIIPNPTANVNRFTVHPSETGVDVALEFVGGVLNFLPMVRVEEKDNVITVGGIPSSNLVNDIYRVWNTMRVPNNLFIERGMRYFKIHSFYAIELIYILDQLLIRGTREMARGMIKTIREKVFTETWVGTAAEAPPLDMDYARIAREMNCTLLPPQMGLLQHFAVTAPKYGMRGLLFAAGPGTGKTIGGYAFTLAVNADLSIIVCPKNAVHEVWEATIQLRFNNPPTYWTSLDKQMFTGKEQYLIVHYEALKTVLDNLDRIKGRDTVVWLDESHNLNELTAARTNYFIDICDKQQARYVMWASGTPLKAIGKETVPLIRTICPQFTRETQDSYIRMFGATKAVALDILSNRLALSTYKVEKGDVVTNEVTELTVNVTLKDPKRFLLPTIKEDMKKYIIERTQYYKENMKSFEEAFHSCLTKFEMTIGNNKQLRNNFETYLSYVHKMHRSFDPRADLDLVTYCKAFERNNIYDALNNADRKVFKKSASVYKYVILTIRGECLGNVLGKRRAECFKAMVAELDLKDIVDTSVKKTLIFSSYVDVVDELSEKSKSLGYQPLLVYGDTNRGLKDMMTKFRVDPKANPMIATYPSLSTAVPVIEASTCVLMDLPFREHIRYQAVSRVDRLGQDAPVRIITILLDTGKVDNISTRNKDIMEWSKAMVDQMLGFDAANMNDVSMD